MTGRASFQNAANGSLDQDATMGPSLAFQQTHMGDVWRKKSKTVILKQGVLQGSVLSPLLFLFYINDLPNGIAQSNVSLFADDVAVWSQASGLLQAKQSLQTNLNHIAEWSKRWKMELSVQKSKCSFFTTSTHEASWRPNLKLSGHVLKYNLLPKFLGVTYDGQLTFVPHAATVGGKLRRQASALRCLATTDWGYDKQTLLATFITTGRSAVEYAAATWLPWVSSSTMEKLETCQRFAGRAITGQVKTTTVEAILADANLPKIGTRATQLCAIALKKSKRTAPENPRHQIAEQSFRQRTKKPEQYGSIFGKTSSAKQPELFPPWMQIGEHIFETSGSKSGNAKADKKWAWQRLGGGWNTFDLVVYTDESATSGTGTGGGGIVVTTGHPSDSQVLRYFAIPTGKWCFYYQAEIKAVFKALQVIQAEVHVQNARIVSDSQSVLLHIQATHPSQPCNDRDEHTVLKTLSMPTARGYQVTFTWCSSHCGITGNELADAQAKKGADADHHYTTAKAMISRATRGGPASHKLTQRIYGDRESKANRKKEDPLGRRDQVTSGRLRFGHHMELKYWLAKINRAVDTICRKCVLGDETAEYTIYKCPRIHRPPAEPPLPNTMALNPKLTLMIWDKWKSMSDLSNISQPQPLLH